MNKKSNNLTDELVDVIENMDEDAISRQIETSPFNIFLNGKMTSDDYKGVMKLIKEIFKDDAAADDDAADDDTTDIEDSYIDSKSEPEVTSVEQGCQNKDDAIANDKFSWLTFATDAQKEAYSNAPEATRNTIKESAHYANINTMAGINMFWENYALPIINADKSTQPVGKNANGALTSSLLEYYNTMRQDETCKRNEFVQKIHDMLYAHMRPITDGGWVEYNKEDKNLYMTIEHTRLRLWMNEVYGGAMDNVDIKSCMDDAMKLLNANDDLHDMQFSAALNSNSSAYIIKMTFTSRS